MRKHWKLLVATHVAAAGAGFLAAPKDLLDSEVTRDGMFTVDTKRVLSATVESLRAENKLLVYSFKGSAVVSVEREKLWIFKGRQQMVIPGQVNYLVDLSQLTLDKVVYDGRTKIVTVELPGLVMSDVNLQPDQATTMNGGILTFDEDQVEELRKHNFASARRAITKQAQGAELVKAAKTEAKKNIASYFEIPLRIAGQPDVKVVAIFEG